MNEIAPRVLLGAILALATPQAVVSIVHYLRIDRQTRANIRHGKHVWFEWERLPGFSKTSLINKLICYLASSDPVKAPAQVPTPAPATSWTDNGLAPFGTSSAAGDSGRSVSTISDTRPRSCSWGKASIPPSSRNSLGRTDDEPEEPPATAVVR
ncbi:MULTISPECIES: hypothetical protein [unclassified Streptomyces]|uniref:hypothetical protein n=1 Tax=unclassified Streptomyces TaxID=2593676 RepID=UPI000DC532A0|nr:MULTISPECIES: hypothetical protein [unclassified Streptomyces]RAJ49856.1 hypothetical protein K376_06734 [Streptomyces sp. PsTaAH-130]